MEYGDVIKFRFDDASLAGTSTCIVRYVENGFICFLDDDNVEYTYRFSECVTENRIKGPFFNIWDLDAIKNLS